MFPVNSEVDNMDEIDIIKTINAIDNPLRLTLLCYIYKRGPKTLSEISKSSNYAVDSIAYAIFILKDTGLIEKKGLQYQITKKGIEVLSNIKILEKIEEID